MYLHEVKYSLIHTGVKKTRKVENKHVSMVTGDAALWRSYKYVPCGIFCCKKPNFAVVDRTDFGVLTLFTPRP